jgi:hypothetical protein
MKKSHFKITMFDHNSKESSYDHIYIDTDGRNFITILNELIKKLQPYNFEIDAQDTTISATIVIMGGKNPREETILIEKDK